MTFVRTKNGRSRGVPVTQEVKAMLQQLPRGGQDNPVFTYEGRPFADPKNAWQRARKRAGLEWVRLHDMRHYYCSRLVRRGVSLYITGRLAGHSNPSVTQRYAAISPGDLAQAVAVLDG